MIVECVKIINPNTGELVDKDYGFGLKIGKKYLVMEVYNLFSEKEISYRILNNGFPNSEDHKQFKIVDDKIPSSWVVKMGDDNLYFAPKKWLDKSLWKYSFWEDYHSWENPEAEKCFQEEVALMIEESGFKEETR